MTELYCPACGNKLAPAKWKNRYSANPNCQFLICPQNHHLWDIWSGSYRSGMEFSQVAIGKCECGEVMPERDMNDVEKRKVCPKCFEVAKKAWRMDKEKSYACLEITPIKTADGHCYNLNTSIKIEPYPNPFMYGGSYSGGAAKDEPELEQAIKDFEERAARLKENGMEKVEIKRHDELIRAEQVRLEPTNNTALPELDIDGTDTEIESELETGEKPKQLSLMG